MLHARVDEVMEGMLATAYDEALQLMHRNRAAFDALLAALLEKTTLQGDEVPSPPCSPPRVTGYSACLARCSWRCKPHSFFNLWSRPVHGRLCHILFGLYSRPVKSHPGATGIPAERSGIVSPLLGGMCGGGVLSSI